MSPELLWAWLQGLSSERRQTEGKAGGHRDALSEHRFCVCSFQELNCVTSKGLCFALAGGALRKELSQPRFVAGSVKKVGFAL